MSILTEIKNKYKLVGGSFEFKQNDFADDPNVAGGFGHFIRNGLLANGIGSLGNPQRIELDQVSLSADGRVLTYSGKTTKLFFNQNSEATMAITTTDNDTRVRVELRSVVITSVPYLLDGLEWIPLKAMEFKVVMQWDSGAGAFKFVESRGGLFDLSGGAKLRMELSKVTASQWQLAISQAGDTPLALGDIGKILHLESELSTFLPENFRNTAAGSLAITSLSATIDRTTKKFQLFSLETALVGKSWTAAPGLVVDSVATNFEIERNEEGQLELTTVFSGEVSGHPFSITGVLNSTKPWEATLEEVSIADVFDLFLQNKGISAADFFENTVVAQKFSPTLQVYFQEHTDADGETTPANSFVLHLGPGNDAPVGASLAMEDLGFRFAPKAGSPNQTEISLQGQIVLVLDGNPNTLTFQAKIPGSKQESMQIAGALDMDPGLPVGKFVNFLTSKGFGIGLPGSLEDFYLTKIGFSYTLTPKPNTTEKDKELNFSCAGTLPLDEDLSLDPAIDFYYKKEAGKSEIKVLGELILEVAAETDDAPAQQVALKLAFATDPDDKSFSGSLFVPENNPLTLKTIVGRFDPDMVDSLPDFTLPVPGFFLAYTKKKPEQGVPATTAPKGKLMLGIRPIAGLRFSELPMVGNALPAGMEIGVNNLLFLYIGDTFSAEEVNKINGLLPDEFKMTASDEQPEQFEQGMLISGSAQLGPTTVGIYLPVGKKKSSERRRSTAQPGESSDAPRKWFKVAKRLGPLYISRVGFAYPESRLTLLLEAELALGPLTLAMQGFSIGSRLDRFEPVPGLEGFGLSFVKPPVEISALFLKIGDDVPSGAPAGVIVKDRFAGVAVIKTSKLSISAIGEYASTNRGPSFYLFAYIGYPLGGPAFFFVEGLALGFGFNRSVRLPEVSEINRHPFVAIAMSPSGSLIELAESLISGNYVPITPGSIFLALGIRFTTFKLLDSFALLMAVFGNNNFRLNLLGVSKLVLPPGAKEAGAPPLAEITLNLRGAFDPGEGFFGLDAQLTPDSYILSRSCTLQGGFAFYTWFKGDHEGDFVLTLGGYHPKYNKPAHYPNVPRLGFNWRVSSTVEIKGRMYFALTPTAVMAGGRLEATWNSGNLKAWFIIGADFLISWKPYFYDIYLYLQFGISYTFWFFGRRTLSVELNADLHIWGPEFSGTASIDIRVTSFTVRFGAQTALSQDALTWDTFRESFLPQRVLGMTISDGLIRETPDGSWIVDPDRLVFEVESAVPNQTFRIEGAEQHIGAVPAIGAGPMLTSNLDTDMAIDLDELEASNFNVTPIRKSVPAALWGRSGNIKPEVNPSKRLISDVPSGLRFAVKPPNPPDTIASIRAEFLAFNEDEHGTVDQWAALNNFQPTATAANIRESLLAAYKLPVATGVLEEMDLAVLDLRVESLVLGTY